MGEEQGHCSALPRVIFQQQSWPRPLNGGAKKIRLRLFCLGASNRIPIPQLLRAVTVGVTTASPAVVGCHRWLCIATGGSARDITHSITSIIQTFVNKCNNSNSCKLFYLD